jgi:hypothetical protein
MMFPFPGEAETAREGLIDRVLYGNRAVNPMVPNPI